MLRQDIGHNNGRGCMFGACWHVCKDQRLDLGQVWPSVSLSRQASVLSHARHYGLVSKPSLN